MSRKNFSAPAKRSNPGGYIVNSKPPSSMSTGSNDGTWSLQLRECSRAMSARLRAGTPSAGDIRKMANSSRARRKAPITLAVVAGMEPVE